MVNETGLIILACVSHLMVFPQSTVVPEFTRENLKIKLDELNARISALESMHEAVEKERKKTTTVRGEGTRLEARRTYLTQALTELKKLRDDAPWSRKLENGTDFVPDDHRWQYEAKDGNEKARENGEGLWKFWLADLEKKKLLLVDPARALQAEGVDSETISKIRSIVEDFLKKPEKHAKVEERIRRELNKDLPPDKRKHLISLYLELFKSEGIIAGNQ